MNKLAFPLMFAVVGASACASVSTATTSSEAVLKTVSLNSEDFGKLVYVGKVFRLEGPRDVPLFIYERRVQIHGSLLRSTSFSREGDRVAIIQIAEQTKDDELVSFVEHQFQLGEVGHVEIHGRRVEFRTLRGTEERRAVEETDLPVVVGPTLYRFIVKHWSELQAGETLKFRFAVPNRLETLGFELKKLNNISGEHIQFQMRASSLLIRLAVSPVVLTWTPEQQLVSLEGRVPPMAKKKTGGWEPLDAYVEYVDKVERFE